MTMQITEVKGGQLKNLGESLVIIGCDITTSENRAGFLNGITEILVKGNAVNPGFATPEQLFTSVHFYSPNDLTNLVFVMNPEAFNMGRLPLVRLSIPDCKWLSDYLDIPLSYR